MIDRLELLLERGEEQEEDIPDLFTQSGHGPVLRRRDNGREERGLEAAGPLRGEAAAPSPGKEAGDGERSVEKRTEETVLGEVVSRLFSALPEEAEQIRGQAPEGLPAGKQDGRPERDLTARRGAASFEGQFYERLARTGRAADYRRPRGREYLPLAKPEERRAEGAFLEAAALDRIFQRDARRYDRGFAWQ